VVRNGRGSEEGQVCSRPIMAWVGDVPAGGDFPSSSAVWIGFGAEQRSGRGQVGGDGWWSRVLSQHGR
jgi:hypothetical protein